MNHPMFCTCGSVYCCPAVMEEGDGGDSNEDNLEEMAAQVKNTDINGKTGSYTTAQAIQKVKEGISNVKLLAAAIGYPLHGSRDRKAGEGVFSFNCDRLSAGGAPVQGYVRASLSHPPLTSAPTTTPIQGLCLEVDSFLANKMTEDTMTAEEADTMRTEKVITVRIHGQTTEDLTIEDLERKTATETNSKRITVPSTDILQHQQKSGFPLHFTCKDAESELKEEFRNIVEPREKELQRKDETIETQIINMNKFKQNVDETTKNLIEEVESIVVFGESNQTITKKLMREIKSALLIKHPQVQKLEVLKVLRGTLEKGAEHQMFLNNKAAKAKWGALNNRRGLLGENRTVTAMNHVLGGFQGMSVMGMKTHTYLYDFLKKLGIQLTYHNTQDPNTGRFRKINEVEHDHLATWLEEEHLVINFIQSKTAEIKPWDPPDKERRGQAALEHAKHGLLQIAKDVCTFKELFPDVLESTMNKIR